MNQRFYKLGLRLANIQWIRNAIDQRADLSEFQKPPNFRILAGMFLICISFPMCWPAIAATGAVSIYYHRPMIALVGGPILYVVSHLCYLAGMWLCGQKYSGIFFRWATRCTVERMLSLGFVRPASPPAIDQRNCETATDTPA